MFKYLFLLPAFMLGAFTTNAQTDPTFLPPTSNTKVPICTNVFVAPKVDNANEKKLATENSVETGDKMMRFGKEINTQINFKKEAQLFVHPNGRKIYQLAIECPTAESINLILSDFKLAEDARLFLTDAYSKNYIGAYTQANNNNAAVLGTELLKSEKVIVVLDEPADTEASRFTISTVVHGFEDLEKLAEGLNTSGNCHYDVNCPIGVGYELQRNSVAMMVSGGGFCTGSLVNNTSGTIKPYFLTARHCGINPTSWVFRFRWETAAANTSCASTSNSANGPTTMNINGATFKASKATSDFVLVELNALPDPNWGIYYNGWDNSDDSIATKGVGIHHPDGDVKKISIEEDPLSHQTILFQGANNRTWRISNWDFGTTQGGSSGSPLFNQEKRLIGVLSGGLANCTGTANNGESDYYGRFGFAWDSDTLPNKNLKFWLDSANTGATIIDGIDPLIGNELIDASLASLLGFPEPGCDSVAYPKFSLLNSGISDLTTVTLSYGFTGNPLQTYIWSGSIPTYGQATISLPSVIVPVGQTDFTINVVSANGNPDTDVSNNIINQQITRLQPDFQADFVFNFDCFASETTWEIQDASGVALYQGGPYTDSAFTLNKSFCLPFGCYSVVVKDQWGDGITGDGCSGLYPEGSYTLTNTYNGSVLAELTQAEADFGSEVTKTFCLNFLGLQDVNLDNLVSVYPNPGKNVLNIKGDNVKFKNIKIYSLTGQEVLAQEVTGNQVEINTENLPASFYLVKIITNKGELNQRWIKQ